METAEAATVELKAIISALALQACDLNEEMEDLIKLNSEMMGIVRVKTDAHKIDVLRRDSNAMEAQVYARNQRERIRMHKGL